MAAGIPITAENVNSKVGGLVTNVWDNLNDLNRLYRWFSDASHDDGFFNTIGITGSATTGDLKLLRDSMFNLGSHTNGLYAVAHGIVATGQSDFFVNAKKLTGINFTG